MKYLIPILIIFCSCSTTSKVKNSSKTSIDSSSVLKIDSSTVKTVDSVSVKKDNTVTTVEKSDNYEKETVIEFEPTPSGTKAADYFPIIKRKIITEKGVIVENKRIVANTHDSSRKISTNTTDLKKESKTDLVKTETVKNKEIKRTSYWGWLWIGLIIIFFVAVFWYFGWWQMIFAWIRKKKRKQPYSAPKDKSI